MLDKISVGLYIYVDSRAREGGPATQFEYALPYSSPIRERSLANIGVACLHNSIPAIIPGVSFDGEPNLEQDRLVQDDPEDPLLENFNEDFVDR